MHFTPTKLHGAWLIEPEPVKDNRGFFARTFCAREFAERGLEVTFVQQNISYSSRKGTLRGMHFQAEPHGEVKLIRCLRGAIFDVIIDLDPDSPSYLQWQAFELTADNRRQLYVPRSFAHGFQSLSADAEVGYLMSEFYRPAAGRGFRFDDPAFSIDWPLVPTVMSERDRTWPAFTDDPVVAVAKV